MSIWQNKDILGVITENFVYPHEWKNFALINKTCYQVFINHPNHIYTLGLSAGSFLLPSG